jgi:hypothetical protein
VYNLGYNFRLNLEANVWATTRNLGLLYTRSQGQCSTPNSAFLLVKKLKSAPRALHKESRLQSAPNLLINALWLVCLGAQYKAIIKIIIIF